jgi:hypothetical protein
MSDVTERAPICAADDSPAFHPFSRGPLGRRDHGDPDAPPWLAAWRGPAGLYGAGEASVARTAGTAQRLAPGEADLEVVALTRAEILACLDLADDYAGSIDDLVRLFAAALRHPRDLALRYSTTLSGGQTYVVLRGHPGLRDVLRGTRYLAANTRVLQMSIGARGMLRSGLRSGTVTVVAGLAVDLLRLLLDDSTSWDELGPEFASETTKTLLATAASVLAGTAVGALGAPLVVAIGASIAVGIAVTTALNWIDDRYGVTEALVRWAGRQAEATRESLRDARRWWNFLDSPEGLLWLQRRMLGG